MKNLRAGGTLFPLTFVGLLALPGPSPAEEPYRSKVPGVVIDHSPARSRQYIGSPSLAVLPGGEYVASHDFFGPGSTKSKSVVFRSGDKGKSWEKIADVEGQWWSSLFVHRGALYLMGTSREHGHVVIRRSADGGKTWTEPKDAHTGLLLADGKYHTAPVPVVVHRGRVWRAMEDAMGPGGWGSHFRAFVMSAPEDADLLEAKNWTVSNRVARNPDWLGGTFRGWLEGNAVVAPDGEVVNVLRVHNPPEGGKAAVMEVSADGRRVTFDPEKGFIDFPGGAKKFTIRFDPVSQHYWTLANWVPPRHRSKDPSRVRNTLALARSPALRDWEVRCVLLYHPDTARHGFQYVDWLFDGDDLIAVCRTAHDDGEGGAHNQHDANYMTFHRFPRFRTLTAADSAVNPETLEVPGR
ncbi:MAG TPA: sialidase family protein [Gemmataceae bacterium]